MKKELTCWILAVIFVLSTVAFAGEVSKYWQDLLRKPNQTWITQYGYNNESVLAFNVRSLLEVQNRIAQEVVALQAKVEALSDPNGLTLKSLKLCPHCKPGIVPILMPNQYQICQEHPNDSNEVK